MQKPFSLSGRQLKLIAMVSMLIDHIAVSLVARSSALYTPMRFVGRLAFPLYCLLLVEGFCHTKDRKRYLLSLLGFALISEIPFNMAVAGKIFDLEAQNVFFTLSIGLASLMMADEGKKRGKEWCLAVGYLLIPMLALLLRSDYNVGGVALILVISLSGGFWDRRLSSCPLVIWTASEPWLSPCGICITGRGERSVINTRITRFTPCICWCWGSSG